MNNTTVKLKKIIIVEDHELTRVGLKVALEKYQDIEVIGETASGKEAIELATKLNPDVILMDIGLRELDSYCHSLKEN